MDPAGDADRDREHRTSQPAFDHRQIRVLRLQIPAKQSGDNQRAAEESA